MTIRWLLIGLGLAAAGHGARATDFVGLHLAPDARRLSFTLSRGRADAPVLDAEQVAFGQPRIGPGGRHAGWLVMTPNCCTSYPIALQLVVIDARLRAQRFSGNELPIFGWCFSADGRHVAFRQGVLHGTDAQHYELRALSDGRRLAVFDTPHDAASAPPAARRLPAWAACTEEP